MSVRNPYVRPYVRGSQLSIGDYDLTSINAPAQRSRLLASLSALLVEIQENSRKFNKIQENSTKFSGRIVVQIELV